MSYLLFAILILFQRCYSFQEGMFAYFDQENCPDGWEKEEGGYFLIGQATDKINLMKAQDGSQSGFKTSYKYGTRGGNMKTTLTIDNIPSHSHYFMKTQQGIFHWKNGGGDPFLVNSFVQEQTSYTGGNQPFDITPEYYVATLCKFIQKPINYQRLLEIQNIDFIQMQKSIDQIEKDVESKMKAYFDKKLDDFKKEQDQNLQNLIINYSDKSIKIDSGDNIGLAFGIIGTIIGIGSLIFTYFIYSSVKKMNDKYKQADPKYQTTQMPSDSEQQRIQHQKQKQAQIIK